MPAPGTARPLRRRTPELRNLISWLLPIVYVGAAVSAQADPVAVRFREGLVRGFLVLRTLDGQALASGDLFQNTQGDRVTTRLVFHFKDGSTHDETAVFTQRQYFRLVSHHLVQKGPTFPRPIDMTIAAATGRVTVRYTDDGKAKVDSKVLKLPPDVANGQINTLLKNVRPDGPAITVGYVAATPEPRLVKLEVSAAGQEHFTTAGAGHNATHYVLKVDIGGLSGLVAPLVGKQPPDSHVWILGGETPAFVKSEQTLYLGGPTWRIELVSPEWPKER